MPRITRIAGSFTIVVIAYWAYALAAVPWIEPPVDLSRPGQISPDDQQRGSKLADAQMKELEGLFPPDAWELDKLRTKILETDRAKLLLQDYHPLDDGRLRIDRCTIVIPYDGPGDEAQRRRQSIIMEVPGGAMLKFDQAIDLDHAKGGKLVGGQLIGKVTIRSDWKDPGPEDDLLIVTRDVELTEQTISTPHTVDFRWGPHFGRGSNMVIKLLAGQPKPGTEGANSTVGGMESFELRHVERLHLDLGQATSEPADKSDHTPVEITCSGPFRFDAVRRVAAFSKRVDVRQLNPAGPADQMTCDLLSLYFSQRPAGKPARDAAKSKRKAPDSLDLALQRIEASGNPVVVNAPSKNLIAHGQSLEYDLTAGSLKLDGGREVFLQKDTNEIHAPSLHYQSASRGRLGRVTATGPGWLRGQSPNKPDQQLEATWKDELRVAPQGNHQVISLTGGAGVTFQGLGHIQAKEILLWLLEKPTAIATTAARTAAKDELPDFQPDCMKAVSNVEMNSSELSSKVRVQELLVWFKEGAKSRESAGGGNRGTMVPGLLVGTTTAVGAATRLPSPQSQPVGVAVELPHPQATVPQTPLPQQFEIVGQRLVARVLLSGQQPEVSNLIIDGGVRMEGGGHRLTGPNIHLDRDSNLLWIDGPGQMDLPISRDLQGQPLANPAVLTVDWRRRMEFNGLTAKFEGSVVANTTLRQEQSTSVVQLSAETMYARLLRPIGLTDAKMREPPPVEQIQCSDGVSMESRTLDPQQQLSAFDKMQVTDLVVNVISGVLFGGPGWLNSVRFGSANPLDSPVAAGKAPATAAPPQDQLNCLHVKFEKSITGNVLRRQLKFSDQVQAAYAPVDRWDAMLTDYDPDRLGPQGVSMRCKELSVDQMRTPLGRRPSIELKASGNTVVEGIDFMARGNRITYDQSKELLIIEGDGLNNAELFQQKQVGGPQIRLPAQKIRYSLKTKTGQAVGAQSIQFDAIPNGKAR